MNCKQIETILNKLTVSKNGKILGKSRIIDELHSLHLRTIEVNKISSNVPVISSVCTCTKFRETPMINGKHICSICNKPIVQTDL